MDLHKLEEYEEEDTVLVGVEPTEEEETQQRGKLLEWGLPKVLNPKEEGSVQLEWTYLELVKHYTDLPF